LCQLSQDRTLVERRDPCRGPDNFVSFSVLLGKKQERSRVREMPHLMPSPRAVAAPALGKKMEKG
jgi:hypothetical protein